MAFTLTGDGYFPSAAYSAFDGRTGAGSIFVAKAGVGPQDGFSGYKAFGNPPRPRWGDYGATAVDGNTIWIASEYIGQTCTLAQYTTAPIGSCGAPAPPWPTGTPESARSSRKPHTTGAASQEAAPLHVMSTDWPTVAAWAHGGA